MRKQRFMTIAAAVLAGALLAACGGQKAAPTTAAPAAAPETTAAPAETKAAETKAEEKTAESKEAEAKAPAFEEGQSFPVMEFVSGPANGGWSQIAAAIADKANEHFTGYPITATTGGAVSNPLVMSNGEAMIGLNQGIMLTAAMNGEAPFEGEKITNIRSICSLDMSALYFVVDSKVEENTLGELIKNGTKIKIGSLPAGNAATMLTEMTLAEYGTTLQDISDGDVYITDASGITDAYSDRHIDFVVRNVGIPNSALTELMTGRESKILGIEPEICQALHDKYDWDLCTIPANTYPGQTEDIQTVAVKSVLTVREDCPDAVAYFLAKTMYEEKPYFETVQSAYAKFGPEDMVQGLTVELHPGAKAFWEETGLLK